MDGRYVPCCLGMCGKAERAEQGKRKNGRINMQKDTYIVKFICAVIFWISFIAIFVFALCEDVMLALKGELISVIVSMTSFCTGAKMMDIEWERDRKRRKMPMAYYSTCKYCGCNLDPGEKCDCREFPVINYRPEEDAGHEKEKRQKKASA